MYDLKTLAIRNKEESNLCSGLYLVPTPIGNLRDITLRALDVLHHCDVIVCEDSRVTGQLLKAYDIRDKKKIVYNDHADAGSKDHILDTARDNIVAMVSDAGTPVISDPGFKLVREAMANGLYVTGLPGANAVLPAIQLSGLPSDKFVFGGFLPSKDKAVRDALYHYLNREETLVFYDSPKRVDKTLSVLEDMMPEREIAIVREISKLYEESLKGFATDLLKHITDKPLKGEVVLVISGTDKNTQDYDVDTMIENAMAKGQSVKELSAEIAVVTGLKKKEVYDRALALKQN